MYGLGPVPPGKLFLSKCRSIPTFPLGSNQPDGGPCKAEAADPKKSQDLTCNLFLLTLFKC